MGTDLLAFSMGFVVEHGAGEGYSILKNSPITFAVQSNEAVEVVAVHLDDPGLAADFGVEEVGLDERSICAKQFAEANHLAVLHIIKLVLSTCQGRSSCLASNRSCLRVTPSDRTRPTFY